MRLPIDPEHENTDCLAACLAKCVEGYRGCAIAPEQVAIVGTEMALQCPRADCDVQVPVGHESVVPPDDFDIPTIVARQAAHACLAATREGNLNL